MNYGIVNVPSRYYFDTILDGYMDFGINPEPLFRALKEAHFQCEIQENDFDNE